LPRPPREEAEPTLSPRPMRMPVFSLRRRLHPRANFCWQSQMLDPLFRRRPREKTRVKRRKCRIRRTSCSTREWSARPVYPFRKGSTTRRSPPTFFRSPARLYGCQGSGLIGSNEDQQCQRQELQPAAVANEQLQYPSLQARLFQPLRRRTVGLPTLSTSSSGPRLLQHHAGPLHGLARAGSAKFRQQAGPGRVRTTHLVRDCRSDTSCPAATPLRLDRHDGD
jgi:hypothetical protein